MPQPYMEAKAFLLYVMLLLPLDEYPAPVFPLFCHNFHAENSSPLNECWGKE